ncbi:MAG TPA: ankyrin repeat domain-containing protein [Gammaproteobacteria bacterium]|nr:ankyrin repeat domain-containing protein [Gammaproteobacteria bacterium]
MAGARSVALGLLLAFSNAALAQSEVADATMQRDNDGVRNLLQEGFDVNAAQADGATALHWAAYHGDADLARLLLEAGADASAGNRNGSTPLWLAASQGDAALIETLLEGGADANEALPLGRRPLMLAARSGVVDAVRVLLDRGADPNAAESERGTTALMQAADQGHANVIAVLIEHGADFSARSAPLMRDGRTAALGKANDPRNQVRRQVISVLCEQESPDLSALNALNALASGATEDQLLAQRAAPDLAAEDPCNQERDALGFVRAGGGDDGDDDQSANDAALLANVGAPDLAENSDDDDAGEQPAERTNFFGRRAEREPDGGELTPLVYAARSEAIDAARVLIEAGADVNQTTRYGWSPLLAATQNRNYQMGKFLIEHGADVNIANEGGWTPLYLATDNRNLEGGDYPTRTPDMDDLEYIRLLLDAGADPNARLIESTETRTVFTNQWLDENGATAFLRASQSGDIELMRLLLDHGADPHIYTELDVTPLAVAAGIGWVEGITSEWSTEQTVEAVKLLLELGIDPNHQADTGRVALHGAAHKGATEVVRVLVEAGARMDIRDFGNTDNRGSPELAAHTWLPIDYADGLVRVGVQSAIAHPETAQVLRELMQEAGLDPPPAGRTLDSICIVEVCSADYDPLEYN